MLLCTGAAGQGEGGAGRTEGQDGEHPQQTGQDVTSLPLRDKPFLKIFG